jgi:hypothetical protein
MEFERMLDAHHEPGDEEIVAAIGKRELWQDLRNYVDQSYDFAPELVFYGRKYGWTVRYRKSGRTLVSLFPEQGAFTALVVLGKKDGEKAARVMDELSPSTRDLIGSTEQLHDGKWLWIRVLEPSDVEDVKRLLRAKRRPVAQSAPA